MFKCTAKIVLASSSPRRKAMLTEVGIPFTVTVSAVDETVLGSESPKQLVERLALAKSETVAKQHPDAWVIGADTDVSIDGKIFGKPADAEDAKRIIRAMQGKTHEVWGAFAITNKSSGDQLMESYLSKVTLAPMDEATISRYVATGEPLDKAGAYAIQGIGAQFVTEISGSYTNVVGLNLAALMAALRKLGVLK